MPLETAAWHIREEGKRQRHEPNSFLEMDDMLDEENPDWTHHCISGGNGRFSLIINTENMLRRLEHSKQIVISYITTVYNK